MVIYFFINLFSKYNKKRIIFGKNYVWESIYLFVENLRIKL